MLHPDIFEIVNTISIYRDEHSPITKIEITTNGYGNEVNERLKKIPEDIWVNNTKKDGRYQKKFEAFNIAPCDKWHNILTDFVNGCWITHDCGIGLNRYGYYPCAVAGSIDRVFGFDKGFKKLPDYTSEFNEQKRMLCKYCGHFIRRKFVPVDQRTAVIGEPRSKSWVNSYRKYRENPPVLDMY